MARPVPRVFPDDDTWIALASAARIRLPHQPTALTTGLVETWLRKLAIPRRAYFAWCGVTNLGAFVEANPEWGIRAFVGLLLEAKADGQFG